MSYNMYVPTRFIFRKGRLGELHSQKLPGKKALVVISNGKSTIESGSLHRTITELEIAEIELALFDQVRRIFLNLQSWKAQEVRVMQGKRWVDFSRQTHVR